MNSSNKSDGVDYAELSRRPAQRLENAAWVCGSIAVWMYMMWLLMPFWVGVLDRIADLFGGQ